MKNFIRQLNLISHRRLHRRKRSRREQRPSTQRKTKLSKHLLSAKSGDNNKSGHNHACAFFRYKPPATVNRIPETTKSIIKTVYSLEFCNESADNPVLDIPTRKHITTMFFFAMLAVRIPPVAISREYTTIPTR